MLKYQLNKQVFDNDILNINYNGVELTMYEEDPINFMWVTLLCNNVDEVVPGDTLSISSNFLYINDELNQIESTSDRTTVEVVSVDNMGNTITFLDDKEKELKIDSIIANVYDNVIKWTFNFTDNHYFLLSDEDISLKVYYYHDAYIQLDNIEYVDFRTLVWTYDATVENITELSNIIFGGVSPDNDAEGDISNIIIKREQIRWSTPNQENPTVTASKYKVRFNVPIALKVKTDLYKEGNIREYFVQHEEEKAINTPIEMEKYIYTPVIVKEISNNNLTFEDCTKINFNLHFRVHDGDDWTVSDSNSWNFDKYDNHNDPTGNKYYSYAQNASVAQDQWKRSCQSDLLTYAGFVTNDVKYQKNKLKKSFIRLSYYDSDDPGKQSLLAYSTIFVDCNKLYSKFISRMNFNCYFNSDGDIVKGIKVDREVNTLMPPDSLTALLGAKSLKPEEIEESRLSSQISVKNRFTSNNSSEGFYLYTWELNDIPTIPTDVYMKVEFNHAGYGRNIPMMAPYITKAEHDDPSQGNPYYNKTGFKTNADIAGDWNSNRQYGIKRYTRYSYIHFKTKYDVNTKRHIYYLDPDTYGTKYDWDKSILNINLYEARITFE